MMDIIFYDLLFHVLYRVHLEINPNQSGFSRVINQARGDARFVKVYCSHKLYRNVCSHNSCGNACVISHAYKGSTRIPKTVVGMLVA